MKLYLIKCIKRNREIMKIRKMLIAFILLTGSLAAYSQEKPSSSFKSDLNKADVKTILKAVADWQIRTPLTHDLADWTNGALYTGMVEWAGIAGADSYYCLLYTSHA